LDYGQL
jgi:hypothetical protein